MLASCAVVGGQGSDGQRISCLVSVIWLIMKNEICCKKSLTDSWTLVLVNPNSDESVIDICTSIWLASFSKPVANMNEFQKIFPS